MLYPVQVKYFSLFPCSRIDSSGHTMNSMLAHHAIKDLDAHSKLVWHVLKIIIIIIIYRSTYLWSGRLVTGSLLVLGRPFSSL